MVRMPGKATTDRFGWIPFAATAVALALLALGVTLGEQSRSPDARVLDAPGLALLVGGTLAVAAARWWPQAAYAVAILSIAGYQALGYYTETPYFLGALVAAFLVPRAGEWWRSVLLLAAAIPPFGVAALVRQRPDFLYAMIILIAAAILFGQAAAELRAASGRRQAEARAEEERRMLTEERLRIARELHDVISHSIATIGIQAGVAAHLLDENPEQAREALLAIKAVSRDAMRDLRGMLGVLRQSTDEAEDREPAPGLARLPELLERVRATGLHVDLDVDGEPTPMTPATDLAAYRVVQEGLTNVIRHAPGALAHVHLRYIPDAVCVEVCDNGGSAAAGRSVESAGTGHGLSGLRERAVALGGTLEAGPLERGGFRLLARLPSAQSSA